MWGASGVQRTKLHSNEFLSAADADAITGLLLRAATVLAE